MLDERKIYNVSNPHVHGLRASHRPGSQARNVMGKVDLVLRQHNLIYALPAAYTGRTSVETLPQQIIQISITITILIISDTYK